MTYSDRLPPDLGKMIVASLEGAISPEQQARLSELLEQNPAAQTFYVDFLVTMMGMRHILSDNAGRHVEPEETPGSGSPGAMEKLIREIQSVSEAAPKERQSEKVAKPFESDIFRQVIEQDLHDSAVRKALEETARQKVEQAQRTTAGVYQRGRPNRREVVTAFVKLAAVICLAVGLIWLDRQLWRSVNQPRLHPVARLTDLMGELESADGRMKYDRGRTLFDESYVLAKDGMAAITFDSGAQVILEGPAEFSLENREQMFLQTGKTFAHVPPNAIGFTVDSPSARVIDLGTEFGLDVWDNGTSELYTYVGQVSLVQGQRGGTKRSRIVSAGQARRVDQSTGQVCEIQFKPGNFARRFESTSGMVWQGRPLSLADVVGGSNGFGGGVSRGGINVFTGHQTEQVHFQDQTGPLSYVPVVRNPFIDGVFVPDGGDGPVAVSSTGIIWKDCPDTTRVFNSDVSNLSWTYGHGNQVPLRARGDSGERRLISLHANLGITFDLNAIRKALPGIRVVRFRCEFGISDYDHAEGDHAADVRALVDGVVRAEAVNLTVEDGLRSVDMALNPEDRFLTLVSTEGPDHLTNWDWVIVVDPTLELESD